MQNRKGKRRRVAAGRPLLNAKLAVAHAGIAKRPLWMVGSVSVNWSPRALVSTSRDSPEPAAGASSPPGTVASVLPPQAHVPTAPSNANTCTPALTQNRGGSVTLAPKLSEGVGGTR